MNEITTEIEYSSQTQNGFKIIVLETERELTDEEADIILQNKMKDYITNQIIHRIKLPETKEILSKLNK